MIVAAGIMFIAKNGNALYLKRGPGGDCPGLWCFPGGKQEDGETLEECAVREAIEECGKIPKGERMQWTRSIRNREIAGQTPQPTVPATPPIEAAAAANTPATDAIVIAQEQVDFTTFIQRVDEEFVPKLDGEHTGWAWAPLNDPPEPLHPGCRVAINRLTMDELGVARAIADGVTRTFGCSPFASPAPAFRTAISTTSTFGATPSFT
jgi:8-oxo-dGTP pyrophosphatase MutT (NUDIX family)